MGQSYSKLYGIWWTFLSFFLLKIITAQIRWD